MTKRILAGISVAIAFASLMAFCPGPVQFVLLLAFALACQAEFYALAMRGGYRVYNHTGCILGGLWFLAVYMLTGPRAIQNGTTYGNLVADWESAFIFGGCFLILFRALFDRQCRHAFETTAITGLGIVYGPVMLSYFIRLAQWDSTTQFATTRAGVFLTFFIAMVIKMSDTGAFAVGTACGRHKMFPRISPRRASPAALRPAWPSASASRFSPRSTNGAPTASFTPQVRPPRTSPFPRRRSSPRCWSSSASSAIFSSQCTSAR